MLLSCLNMLAASFEVDLKNHSCIYTFMPRPDPLLVSHLVSFPWWLLLFRVGFWFCLVCWCCFCCGGAGSRWRRARPSTLRAPSSSSCEFSDSICGSSSCADSLCALTSNVRSCCWMDGCCSIMILLFQHNVLKLSSRTCTCAMHMHIISVVLYEYLILTCTSWNVFIIL